MPLTAMYGFHEPLPYADDITYYYNTNRTDGMGVKVPNSWGGSAFAYTSTSAGGGATNTYSASVRIWLPNVNTWSVGFSMNHVAVPPAATYDGAGGVMLYEPDHNTSYGASLAAGYAVGSNAVNPSGAAAGSNQNGGSVTTVGWHWWCVCFNRSSTTGFFRIYRDGVLAWQASGDTIPTLQPTSHMLGIYVGNIGYPANYGCHLADLVISDDTNVIPPTMVAAILPNSTVSAGWDGSDGNRIDNHLLLREVGGGNVTARGAAYDLCMFDSPTITGPTISAVQSTVVVREVFGATLQVRSHVNGVPGPTQYAPGRVLRRMHLVDPADGLPWTNQKVADITVGYEAM